MNIRRGTLKAYDPVTMLATVQIAGSLSLWLEGIPTSYAVAGQMVPGRTVAVAFFDDRIPTDAMVVGVN